MTACGERYELGRLLGCGGFASVFRAFDREQHREVAVKIIPTKDHATVERFRREALALSRLRSPNVARVHDFGRDEELGLFLVMELIEGVPLQIDALGRALTGPEVLIAARALLGGLADVHAARIVHRDVKPQNVLVPGGVGGLAQLKLLDFGIAGAARPLEAEKDMLGTLAYMAPEQLRNEGSDAASDVYSAGLVLFELLGQGALFEGDPRAQVKARVERDPDVRARAPEPLGTLLAKMLARDPGARFPDAIQALAAINNLETAPIELVDAPLRVQPERRRSSYPSIPAKPRALLALPRDATAAFDSALSALDLPMLDALARRERGTDIGLVARATALAMRLELDAAADVIEPALTHPLARGVAQAIIGPRARKVTRARLERGGDWVTELPAPLVARLVALGAALMKASDAARVAAWATQLAPRLLEGSSEWTTASIARHVAERMTAPSRSQRDVDYALALVEHGPADRASEISRALVVAFLAFRIDDHVTREHVERAARVAAEANATLLEVRALVAWGGLLQELPARRREGVRILERAATLLESADAPALEHVVAHNLGLALELDRDFDAARRLFRRSRLAAEGELTPEDVTIPAANELMTLLCTEQPDASEVRAALTDEAIRASNDRAVAIALVARALWEIRFGTHERAQEDVRRALRTSEGAQGTDAHLFASVLQVLLDAARGDPVDVLARAGTLESLAAERGHGAFVWLSIVRSVLERVADGEPKRAMESALDRLTLLFAPLDAANGGEGEAPDARGNG